MQRLLKEINDTEKEELEAASEASQGQKGEDLKRDLSEKIKNINFESVKEDAVKIDKDNWMEAFSRYPEDSGRLYNDYTKVYEAEYSNAVKKYEQVKREIEAWKNDNWEEKNDEDIANISSMVNTYIGEIVTTVSEINTSIGEIGDWKTYNLNNDISSYRAKFKLESRNLRAKFERLKNDLEEIQDITEQIEKKSSDSSSEEY